MIIFKKCIEKYGIYLLINNIMLNQFQGSGFRYSRGLKPGEDLRALLFLQTFLLQEICKLTKPFLTYNSQLYKLTNEKKLIITDRVKALQILKDIGYFSLIGGYKTPFIKPMTRIYQNKINLH